MKMIASNQNMASNRLKYSLSQWRTALFGLLCVVVSQGALAGHQFEHQDMLVVESCAVCIQLEQLDSPQVAVAFSLEPLEPAVAHRMVAAHFAPLNSFRHYASRAPPVI